MNKILLSWLVAPFLSSAAAFGQSFYLVEKTQLSLQTSASAPSPFTNFGPYLFSSQAPSAATLTPPGLAGMPMAFNSGNSDYELHGSLATKAALDAAFPNGSYKFSGSGFPNGTVNISGDLYPTVPQVTNGTWQNGVLVVDPSQNYTINLNNFSSYATGGIGGYMDLKITSEGSADNVTLEQTYCTIAGVGATVSPTPFTSYVIPAHALTAGLPYRLVISYYTVTSYDSTTIPGSGLVGMYENTLIVYVVGKSSTSIAPPVIATQPVNQAVVSGTSATFAPVVTFNGSTGIPNNATSILWYFVTPQSSPTIVGGPGGKYSPVGNSPCGIAVNNVGASDVGSYYLEVINGGGLALSQTATLSLVTGIPVITTQPAASQSVNAGANVALSVVATNAGTYQWQLNGSPVAGATNATLALSNIGTAQRGAYTVVVSNSLGSATSNPATVAVSVGSYLFNISSRAYLGSGPYQNIVAGFYTNGSGSKWVVVRGIGPNLAVVDPPLTGLTLNNPKLTLFNGSSTALYTNTGWGSSQTLINAFASVYAAPLQNNSNDTAIFDPVPAGSGVGYTAEVDSANNGTGIALVEVYDYDAYTGTPASNLINISTRAFVGPGNDALVAGFWSIGSTSQTLLIRAVGPGLAAGNPALNGLNLVTPTLTLFDSTGAVIGTNTGWGTAPVRGNSTVAAGIQPATTAIMNGVYASPIAAGSADCAMVVTLPGNAGYTAQVNGAGSTTGIALVEVYNVP